MNATDPELQAMFTITETLADLDEPTRIRVIQWLGAKYLSKPNLNKDEDSKTYNEAEPRLLDGYNKLTEEKKFTSFSEMIAETGTTKTIDRLLLAAYWTQVVTNKQTWELKEVGNIMKTAGFPVDHISRTIDPLKSGRPAKIFIDSQSGTKKLFKMSEPAIKEAESIIGGKPASVDAVQDQPVKAKKNQVSKSSESYSFVKDLDLSSKSGQKSLKDFYTEKSPQNDMERNLVIIYYLERIRGMKKISIDHVYTSYKDVEQKVPVLTKSFNNTSTRKGWLSTADLKDLTVTTPGENYVELELPRKIKDA